MSIGLGSNSSQGILLIDKPSGWTSHDVVDKIRRLTGVKKVGHAGTLDPLATGLLIILVGREFTKQQPMFLKQDKSYVCTGILGIETDTYDIDGKIIKTSDKINIDRLDLEKSLQKYQGKINQTVPAYSAVRHQGKKLYQLARKNQSVALPQRQVEISNLELVNFQSNEFTLKISCSSGTYIRSLVHDIGQDLGCGAAVKSLRRTRSGEFELDQAMSMSEFIKSRS